ncbi:DNA methyltransferase [Brevundimonas aurifodinae]|uniref:site-specific DNA-methyltransferase (adenine-specific) n=2 Tax=Brevundimonas TaxID=41275 RepID=A0ABV1NMD8_9CAUL|nr:MAG: site-specific DNA-methyltransferase [Brevundimonas subvibrioides]
MQTPAANTLFYGDNLSILREHIADDSVDLIYLDPPFNSNANYNVLFRAPGGEQSQSQIEAFEDTWHWNVSAERAYAEVLQSGTSDAANMLAAMRSFLGTNDMMAYLAMMAVRLIELHRVLKPTGSLYLHCDPTASHYLKLLLDAVFGPTNYRNEIIWKRQTAHSDATNKFSDVSDVILFYAKSPLFKFKPVHVAHDPAYLTKFYRHDDADGRGPYQLDNTTSPNPRPNMMYEWMGYPFPSKGWRYERKTMQRLHDEGRLHYPVFKDGTPDYSKRIRLKRYLSEQTGSIVTNVWTDINPLHAGSAERLGYPTQKPLALLERILAASSNEGDVVLDPFCGCGTTVHAAQKMGRRWIGIDVTHLAVGLIQRRLRDAFPLAEFQVLGTPRDLGAARALAEADKHQFQLWALSMIDNAVPYKGGRKGADGGVDGYVYFQVTTDRGEGKGNRTDTGKAIVSIKGGGVTDSQVKDLITTVDHEGAQMGLFVTLLPPTKPMVTRAAAGGFYEAGGRTYPKVQILTIEQLFDGKRPEMPWLDPSVFKKAKREAGPDKQGTLL